jgi:hypothetical protein
MNLLRASYLKKTSAIVFLTLLVLVHAVKALHTHEISSGCHHHQADNSDTDVKANFSCSICDFQLAKDSDAVVSKIEIITPEHRITAFYHYVLSVYNSIVESSSGTDPPIFA